VSPLSDVQYSRFTETEFCKLLTFRSGGRLEALIPMTDDERVDVETHLKEHFGQSMAIQVKAAHVLYRHGGVSRLQKRFLVKRNRIVDDEFFFYFFGYMGIAEMTYRAPVFLVPSHVVHTQAVHRRVGNIVYFNFVASMSPNSHDKWRPYAMDPSDVADQVIAFLRSHRGRTDRTGKTGLGLTTPGTIWVGRAA
jgi:hypothetical protein